MLLSIVIPAYNEEKQLPGCLSSVTEAITSLGVEKACEVIVCDNNSSDDTAQIALAAGATVVFEPINQIGRARNTGAAEARGSWLLFIDADSRLAPANLAAVISLARADGPILGGGSIITLDNLPRLARLVLWGWNLTSRVARIAAGSFIFCRVQAFQALGGFHTDFFAAEELDFSKRLKRWCAQQGGRFVILTVLPHLSSGRKFQLFSARELLTYSWRVAFSYRKLVRSRAGLDFFYNGRR